MAVRRRGGKRRFGGYGPNRYARAAGSLVSTAMRFRGFGSRTGTRSGRKRAAPFPITGESDARAVYRRKRMPAVRRRRWVRFTKRTKAVISKTVAPSFLVRLRGATITSGVNKQEFYQGHNAMGINSAHTDFQDVLVLLDQVQALGGSTFQPDRFLVTGWMCETQVVNSGVTTAYIDMYYYRTKKDVPNPFQGNAFGSPAAVWDVGNGTIQGVHPLGGSTLDKFDYGLTPFNNSIFAKYLQVTRKVRVKLSPGGVTQVETRSGKNYFLAWEDLQGKAMAKWKTEGIFMVFYGTPSALDPVAQPVTLSFSTNVNYTYRLIQSSAVTGGTTQA